MPGVWHVNIANILLETMPFGCIHFSLPFLQSKFTSSANPLGLRVLAYYLLLFPSLDVVSAYPLMVHTVVNNLYLIITGQDTSKPPSHKYRWPDFFLRMAMRLLVAVLPILAAFGVANLVYVLKYAGLMGFNICFFFPTVLQMRSIYVCKRKFTPKHISMSGSHGTSEEHQSLLASPENNTFLSTRQQSLLSHQQLKGKERRLQYMTLYSNAVLSHPLGVLVVGVLGVILFILTLASLGVHTDKVSCSLDL